MKRILLATFPCFILAAFSISGCISAQRHYEDTHGNQERNMTVGIVQKEIRKGMSGADVATALGSPNIVTTDEQGREVWIYDKISTDVTYSQSSGGGGIALLVGGIAGNVAGGAGTGGSYSRSAGAASKTQRTLTVVIKYDDQKKVRDFAYHQSQF
jgi:outer membrane protein assembly factor BamE (lipoprotein component of BamABCDE complex)